MSSSPKGTAGADCVDPKDLKISAAIANQNAASPPSADPTTTSLLLAEPESLNPHSSATTTTIKLPPSPLVTPPMGSNPSRVAQQAVSPRNLLPSTQATASAAAAAASLSGNNNATTAGDSSSSSSSSSQVKQQQEQSNRGVPHIYHDYAKLSGPGPAYIRKKTGGVTQPFPDKLHEMLSHESSDDPASAIVSWLPHGRAFIVRKPKEFTTQVMPKYFRQTKLTSFQRQLNLYGFRRITQGADSGAYYHPLFLQGRPSLSQRMVRQKVKGTGHKQPSDASSEPNFYTMPPVEPEYPMMATTWGARYKPTILPPLQEAQPMHALVQQQQQQQQQPLQQNVQPVPPVVPQPAVKPSPAIAAGADPAQLVNGIDPNSPGFSSLHGAAQLLHGISSGRSGGAFLGPPAADGSAAPSSMAQFPRHRPASFLEPDQLKEV